MRRGNGCFACLLGSLFGGQVFAAEKVEDTVLLLVTAGRIAESARTVPQAA